jgi:hypothetical protein
LIRCGGRLGASAVAFEIEFPKSPFKNTQSSFPNNSNLNEFSIFSSKAFPALTIRAIQATSAVSI